MLTNGKPTKCLIDGCEREARTRGLCNVCYIAAHKAITAGEATWDQLVSMGLSAESKRGPKRTAGLFQQALDAAHARKDRRR